MKNKFYLKEFRYFDGEETVVFDIIERNDERGIITVAVTNRGKISYLEYDLLSDENGSYFEYGHDYARIDVDDFEEVLS